MRNRVKKVKLGEEFLYFVTKKDFVDKVKKIEEMIPEEATAIVLSVAHSGGMDDVMYYEVPNV